MGEHVLAGAPRWVRIASGLVRRLPAGRYRVIHQLCPRGRSAFWMTLPTELGGLAFICDLRDSVAREVCFTGLYEPQETMLVRATLRPGATFVDVGANWGYYTLLGAHLVGPRGRVLSLEPHPGLHGRLRQAVEHSQLAQVTTLPLAAADRAGSVRLEGYTPADGNSGLSRIDPDAEPGPGLEVETRALDELLDDHGLDTVDLMKMDIEGAESLAVDGLRRALSTGRVRRLLLELHPALLAGAERTPRSLLDQVTAYGYEVWGIDHSANMTRRAAYGRVDNPAGFLQAGGDRALADPWPHVFLTLPGLEPNPCNQ